MEVTLIRWRRVIGSLLLLLGAGAAYLFLYEPPYGGRLVRQPDRTLVFAHRGSLEAGLDGVAVDALLSADTGLVIHHDLRTFEDLVRTVKGRGILLVELKVPGPKPTGIEERAVEIIHRHGAYTSVVLSSFNPLVLGRLKRLDPEIRTAFIFMDTNWNPELLAGIRPEERVDLPWFLRQEWVRRAIRKLVEPDMLSINYEVDEKVVDRLIGKGWPAFIWTPDEEADLRRAFAKRPYGVISDQPLRAKRIRDE